MSELGEEAALRRRRETVASHHFGKRCGIGPAGRFRSATSKATICSVCIVAVPLDQESPASTRGRSTGFMSQSPHENEPPDEHLPAAVAARGSTT
jgi:hypothetical protein